MDLNSEIKLNQLGDNLLQILKDLTCSICKKFIQNPVGLQLCIHRFCERCVIQRKEEGKFDCVVCKKESPKSNTFRNQSQLKFYISSFKNLIDILNKNCKSPVISQLFDCVHLGQNNELLNSKENVSEKVDLNDSLSVSAFVPQFNSTSVKNRKTAKFISQNESTIMVLNDRKNIVEETIIEKTKLNFSDDRSIRKHVDETIVKTDILTTTIETAPNSQILMEADNSEDDLKWLDETTVINDSLEAPMKGNDHLNDSPMILSDDLSLELRDTDSYQTQSQYNVLKQSITYTHKAEDKFDRIVKNSDKSISDLNESTKQNISDEDNNFHPKSYTRSESPELIFSDFGSDDSLLYSNLP